MLFRGFLETRNKVSSPGFRSLGFMAYEQQTIHFFGHPSSLEGSRRPLKNEAYHLTASRDASVRLCNLASVEQKLQPTKKSSLHSMVNTLVSGPKI